MRTDVLEATDAPAGPEAGSAPAVRPGRDLRARRLRAAMIAASALALLAALMVSSLLIGSHTVPVATIREAFTAFDPGDAEHVVIRAIRAPRTVVGLLVGVALGAAGAMMQALTKNPLAEPGLLGVNSGAAAAVAVSMAVLGRPVPVVLVLVAMGGAAITGALVLLVGGAMAPRPDPIRLVLAGAALSTVLGAVSGSLVITYPDVFADFRFWDAGAVVHRPWSMIGLGAVLIALALLLSVLAARSVDALSLGDDMGRALGASPLKAWLLAGIASVVLCGTATALAGPIAFIGLAAPLAARRLVGERQVVVVGLSALFASSLLLLSDVVGRLLVRPDEVQASVVAAVIGAPVFIAVVRRARLGALR